MNTTRLFDVLRVVGAVLIAAGLGATVIGGYGGVQADADWCGHPALAAFDPSEVTDAPQRSGHEGVPLPVLPYEELSPAEQRAVEKAVESTGGTGSVTGSFPHREEFERGAVVPYEGERYYVTVSSLDECVQVPSGTLPVGLGVLGLGTVAYLLPGFAGRAVGRERSPRGVRTALRDGSLAEPALVSAFGAGVLFALFYPLGIVLAGVAVGLTAASPSRAVVLGTYLAGTVAALVVLFGELQLGWVPPALLGLSGWASVAVEAALAVAATVVSRLVT